jgi:GTPase
MTFDFSTSAGAGRLFDIPKHAQALLVGVYRQSKEKQMAQEHLEELKRLSNTFGLIPHQLALAPLRTVVAGTFLGKGKIDELKQLAEEKDCDVVIFDEEISPQQQRNIEKTIGIPVIDRTELILGVFAQRAQTKEAKIQVQLASFRYQLPRLKRLWTHLSRQRTGGRSGKGGYLKGAGERQIEVDRRLIKTKISQLESDLKTVKKQRATQRAKRQKQELPLFAIVGYTNAGKSTLLKALTKASVLVEDKLFATLDTTTRKFTLPNNQAILLIDTVGFIRKLPHQLVAAFKSTLEEVSFADVILHVVDGSSEQAYDQAEVTCIILKELQAGKTPMITVINKADQGVTRSAKKVQFKLSNSVVISALQKTGFEALLKKMVKEIQDLQRRALFVFHQKDYRYLASLQKEGHIESITYEGDEILVAASLPKDRWHKYEKFLQG